MIEFRNITVIISAAAAVLPVMTLRRTRDFFFCVSCMLGGMLPQPQPKMSVNGEESMIVCRLNMEPIT